MIFKVDRTQFFILSIFYTNIEQVIESYRYVKAFSFKYKSIHKKENLLWRSISN